MLLISIGLIVIGILLLYSAVTGIPVRELFNAQ